MTRQAYTVAEAAAILGRSAYTIRRWLATGVLRGTKRPGATWVIPTDAVTELLEAYHAERAESQRGEPVLPEAGPPVGGAGEHAEREAPFAVRRIEDRRSGRAPGAASSAGRLDTAGSAHRPSWTVPPEVAR